MTSGSRAIKPADLDSAFVVSSRGEKESPDVPGQIWLGSHHGHNTDISALSFNDPPERLAFMSHTPNVIYSNHFISPQTQEFLLAIIFYFISHVFSEGTGINLYRRPFVTSQPRPFVTSQPIYFFFPQKIYGDCSGMLGACKTTCDWFCRRGH